IADSHGRHGHVQEVIVQNFLPKPDTAMHRSPPCPEDEYLWSIAVARLLLPEDVHVQAPPNLSDDFGRLLDAGIDDWGGVSPVTPDHVNPERPWPAVDRIRQGTEARGFALAPRLTVSPPLVLRRTRRGPAGRGRGRAGRRAGAGGGGRHGHVGREPRHRLHGHLHVQVPILRVLEGAAVADPAGRPVPARRGGDPAPRGGGGGGGR